MFTTKTQLLATVDTTTATAPSPLVPTVRDWAFISIPVLVCLLLITLVWGIKGA